jgi:hypothetical protein
MRYLRNKWILLCFNVLLTTIFVVANAPEFNLLHFINTLFYITFLYVMLSLFLMTVRGKFWDPIIISFRKVFQTFSRERDYIEELEYKAPSEKVSRSFINSLLFQGVALVIILSILLFIYYM